MSSEHRAHQGKHSGGAEGFDGEIDARSIVSIGIWLAVVSVVSFALGWLFYKGLSSYERKALDAKPSPIQEANAPRRPLGPQLQVRPELDLAAFRAAERERLNGWGWVDAGKSVAHVPVETAIEAVVANGLPDFAPPAQVPEP